MFTFLYITWNIDPEIANIGGYSLRYYSLLFVGGLVLCAWLLNKMTRREGVPDDDFTSLVFYGLVGLVAGARLGHCLFYEPAYYLAHPVEMILPIQHLPLGGWQFTGYQGLASHGGVLGLVLAIAIFARVKRVKFIKVLDLVSVVAPLAGVFIRLANLMNSEIIGAATDVPWAFVFERVDLLPRHPAQLYEATCYLLIFVVDYLMYLKLNSNVRGGFFFGLSAVLIFSARFVVEFFKEYQVDFESHMQLDMGQWLSLPFIAIGACFLWYGLHKTSKEV